MYHTFGSKIKVGFFGYDRMHTHIGERVKNTFCKTFSARIICTEIKKNTQSSSKLLKGSLFNGNANSYFHFNSQVNCSIVSMCKYTCLSQHLALFLKDKIESFSHCTHLSEKHFICHVYTGGGGRTVYTPY